MRAILLNLCLMLAIVFTACTPAAENPELVAPNVFVRGLQLPSGVRYTATFIKPTDTTELREVVVEITLPLTVALTGMSVPRQVTSAEVRENGLTRTLVWRIAQVEADAAMDTLAFNVSEPLDDGLEFFMAWRDVDGLEHSEHFTDFPPVQAAGQAEAQLTVTQAGFLPIGESGVQVSAPVREPALQLRVKVLPAAFNPPAEYGAFWWCSLVEVEGVPAGETVDVIVPLRRPIAPFTSLALFRQNADGSWSPAPGQGVVTADGLFVAYAHPGGVLATGGDQTLQPAQVDFATVSDGTSNTIIVSEATAAAQFNVAPTSQVTDGTSNTIIISEATAAAQLNVVPTSQVTDGTSNTIIISEATAAAPLNVAPTSQVTDGTSNTIIISEATRTPVTVRIVTATPTSRAAAQPTLTRAPLPAITLGPVIAINPTRATVTSAPQGANSVRVVIMTRTTGVVQCQVGGVLCSPLRRIAKPKP